MAIILRKQIENPSNSKNILEGSLYQERLRTFNEGVVFNENKGNLIFCITLYNESSEQLLLSLYAVAMSIGHYYFQSTNRKGVSIVIIADGVDKISASTNNLFRHLKIDENEQIANDLLISENSISIKSIVSYFLSRLNSIELDKNWNVLYSAWKKHAVVIDENLFDKKDSVNILLIKKKENVGKLDSHWVFFKLICEKLNPELCFQLDTGTMPGINSISEFETYFNNNTTIGAAASRVMVSDSNLPTNVLQSWQFGDFISQKLLDWPAELYSGYLSVMPGQFCAFRWQALINKNENKTNVTSPIDNYFRGLNKLGMFQSNMFLAEDRILGFEIVTNKSSFYRLGYVPSIVAITDTCNTMDELFHQRRRWINSSFFCNLWLLLNLPKLLKGKTNNIIYKLQTIVSSLWLLLNNIIQWLFPSLVLSLLFFMQKNIIIEYTPLSYLMQYSIPLFLILLIIQLVLFLRKKINSMNLRFVWLSSVIQFFIFIFIFTYYINQNKIELVELNILTILLLEIVILIISGLFTSMATFKGLLKHVFTYLLARPIVSMLLSMHSFSNIDDLSWGTKGIHSQPDAKFNNQNISFLLKHNNKIFKSVFLVLWVLSNAFIFVSVIYNHKQNFVINLLVFLIVTYFLFKIFSGLVFASIKLIKYKFS